MKALILLMPEGFRDEEFKIPKDRLEAAGIPVDVAGLRRGEARGMLGLRVSPEIILDEINLEDYDALVIPGGSGSPRYMWDNPSVISLVKKAYEKGKVVAAICLSTVVLANADILKGRNATVFETPESLRILRLKGVNHIRQGVVVDGKIVTADGPRSAERFADEIIRLLNAR